MVQVCKKKEERKYYSHLDIFIAFGSLLTVSKFNASLFLDFEKSCPAICTVPKNLEIE